MAVWDVGIDVFAAGTSLEGRPPVGVKYCMMNVLLKGDNAGDNVVTLRKDNGVAIASFPETDARRFVNIVVDRTDIFLSRHADGERLLTSWVEVPPNYVTLVREPGEGVFAFPISGTYQVLNAITTDPLGISVVYNGADQTYHTEQEVRGMVLFRNSNSDRLQIFTSSSYLTIVSARYVT